MKNLTHIKRIVNDKLAPFIPKAKRRRLFWGILGISAQIFVSLNSAGRRLSKVVNTGLSRMQRLIGDAKLGKFLQEALIYVVLKPCTGRVYLNIDHSQFKNFTIAVIGLQTGFGRSLPFWVQVNFGKKRALIKPLMATLHHLVAQIRTINPNLEVVLVGDRWFSTNRLIHFCHQQGLLYIFRAKQNRLVQTSAGVRHIRAVRQKVSQVKVAGLQMRLIACRSRAYKENLYLLTNTTDLNYQQLKNRYAARWEIETAFKDLKHVSDLKKHQVRSVVSFRNLLLFVFVGWFLTVELAGGIKALKDLPKLPAKKERSWFTRLFEEHLLPLGYIWKFQLDKLPKNQAWLAELLWCTSNPPLKV